MNEILSRFGALWTQAVDIWADGGWAMIAIALVALVMFALGLHVYFKLRAKGFRSTPEKVWRRWIDHPDQRSGPIGEILDFVMGASSIEEMERHFEELRTVETVPFDRDLRVMRICVGVAPLLGLLGTVTGMLATFAALSAGSGGEKTMGEVAGGISEALVTTETGLMVALPGVFFQHVLARQHERYEAFLAHVETVCTQTLYRKLHAKKAS